MAEKLLDRVKDTIRLKHLSKRTEEAYVHWIKNFIIFHNKRHPAELGEGEIRVYLNHLAQHECVSSSTQNQALNAIIFLYTRVLDKKIGDIGPVVRAKRTQRLPVVFSVSEVKSIPRKYNLYRHKFLSYRKFSRERNIHCAN
jgi:hypothetical protein